MHTESPNPEDVSERGRQEPVGIKKSRKFPLMDCRLKKQGQDEDKKIYLL